METLMQLFGSMMIFVYHCFDRIVINGYLSTLSRPEQVVYFLKKVLAQTMHYQKRFCRHAPRTTISGLNSYARNSQHPDRMGRVRSS